MHSLKATPETVHWGHLQADLPPCLEVQSGDRVVVETFSGGRADRRWLEGDTNPTETWGALVSLLLLIALFWWGFSNLPLVGGH
jgi:hypothetical protein